MKLAGVDVAFIRSGDGKMIKIYGTFLRGGDWKIMVMLTKIAVAFIYGCR